MTPAEILARHRIAADAAAVRLGARWWAGKLVWRPPPGKVQILAINTYARMKDLQKHILVEVEP